MRERERERSSAYHHSTDVVTKCVGLCVSSLRLSGKLQRWPVSMDQVNQLHLKKKKNICSVAVICSDDRGGKNQRIRMRTFSCQRPLAKRRKFIFQVDTVKAPCCRTVMVSCGIMNTWLFYYLTKWFKDFSWLSNHYFLKILHYFFYIILKFHFILDCVVLKWQFLLNILSKLAKKSTLPTTYNHSLLSWYFHFLYDWLWSYIVTFVACKRCCVYGFFEGDCCSESRAVID